MINEQTLKIINYAINDMIDLERFNFDEFSYIYGVDKSEYKAFEEKILTVDQLNDNDIEIACYLLIYFINRHGSSDLQTIYLLDIKTILSEICKLKGILLS